jgi:hypothetical protein
MVDVSAVESKIPSLDIQATPFLFLTVNDIVICFVAVSIDVAYCILEPSAKQTSFKSPSAVVVCCSVQAPAPKQSFSK